MKLLPAVSIPANSPYLPNKYTRWYYSLILGAQVRQQPDGYYERHHIIPVCMFEYNNRAKHSQGFLPGNPNQPDNLVKLSYREHLIAHWLLTKMLNGIWKYKMEAALGQFKCNKYKQPLTSIEVDRIKRANKAKSKGFKWWNNGLRHLLSENCPGTGFVRGMLPKSGRAYQVWNNGVITTSSPDRPGPEWTLGKSPSANTSKGIRWYNNGVTSIQSHSHPGDGWTLGRYKSDDAKQDISNKLKGIKWWFNGERWTRSQICPGAGWTLTKRTIQPSSCKGHQFWNNGESQKISLVSPGPGWVQGRIPGTSASTGRPNINKGRKLWNNGVSQMTAHECPGPGWTQGRIK